MIALLHEGNLMQIEGAQLAPDKGQAERVKNYARLSEFEAEIPPKDPCASLARAEELLFRDAANEAEGRSLLFHGGNIMVNAAVFFVIGAGFGHWTSATISLLTGIATGEIMIFTQPVGALETLHAYGGADFAPPVAATRLTVVPLVARNASGLILVLTF